MKIAINNNGRIAFVDMGDVLSVVAQGNYALLQRESGACRLRGAISVIAKTLEPRGFIQISRSVLVNRAWIDEIYPYVPGKYLLRLKTGREFVITRTFKKNLKSLAEIWLGNDTLVGN